MDQGAYRREVALELARGIVEDPRSPADEIAVASTIATARGAEVVRETRSTRRRWARVRGPFSRAA